MKIRRARLLQQMRIWVYWLLLALIVIRSLSNRMDFWDGILFCALLLLPFFEICPVCGQISWWESARRWPNQVWIGRECRRDRCDRS
jgi:hypothetical protein